MSYQSIDKSRLRSLLAAVETKELGRFLVENKTRLMMAGGAAVKLDNIPRDADKVILKVASLPLKCFAIFSEWVRDNVDAVNFDSEAAVKELIAYDQGQAPVDETRLREVRLAVLCAALSPEPSSTIQAYLQASQMPSVVLESPTAEEHRTEAAERIPERSPTIVAPANPVTPPVLDEIDEREDEVVGVCTKLLKEGGGFIDVLAVRRRGDITLLDDQLLRRQLFPASGSIFFAGGRNERAVQEGEYSIWHVKRQDAQSGKSAQYRTAGHVANVYVVFQCPFRSTQYDEVRDWLRNTPLGDPANRHVYRLLDGAFIKPKSDHVNLRAFDFSQPFDAWNSLEIVDIYRTAVVLGPLRPADHIYECAELGATFRKALARAATLADIPQLSKQQQSALAAALKEHAESVLSGDRIRRVLAAAEAIFMDQESMKMLEEHLWGLPQAQDLLEKRIASAQREHLEKKDVLTSEVDRLERRREELKKQLIRLETEIDEAGPKVSKAVIRAFHKAQLSGEEILGESAVIGAILDRSRPVEQQATPLMPSDRMLHRQEFESNSPREPVDALLEIGFNRQKAQQLAPLLSACFKVGIAVAFQGAGCHWTTRQVAQLLCKQRGLLIQGTAGLVDPQPLRDLISKEGVWDIVCLSRVNLSDTESYGQSLEDILWMRLASRADCPSPRILMSLCTGPASLPISSSLYPLMLVVDLDKSIPQPEHPMPPDDWLEQTLERARESGRELGLWKTALRRLVEELGASQSSEALAYLDDGLVRRFLGAI